MQRVEIDTIGPDSFKDCNNEHTHQDQLLDKSKLGCNARKPVFGVSDKVRLKQDAQAGLHLCCSQTTEDRFSCGDEL